MGNFYDQPFNPEHTHIFLGEGHAKNERKTWSVIALCTLMMLAEIIGGNLFGSLALVADGLHMSTHAGAMLIAALAYTYARKHASNPYFVFGTGKLGDLAGYTSAIILAMISILIAYEAVMRLLEPVTIRFGEAIPIAIVGLLVNVASVWLLSGSDHGHDHGHGHHHAHNDSNAHCHDHDEVKEIIAAEGVFQLSIVEDGTPPVFRIAGSNMARLATLADLQVQTMRDNGSRQRFHFVRKGEFWESVDSIPEPHAFKAALTLSGVEHVVEFKEHVHDHGEEHTVDSRDHNMRAAYIHVIADAAVSVMAIIGLLLAKTFGWTWMDPLAGIIGALVIANWSYSLIRQTGAILVDASADKGMEKKIRAVVNEFGDELVDLHIWRLGPGHLGVVVSVVSMEVKRNPQSYHRRLNQFKGLSHITVEVHTRTPN